MNELDAAMEALSRCHMRLRRDHPYFAVLTMFPSYHFDRTTDVGMVSGKRIHMNPDAFLALDDDARAGLLLHLTLHAALLHATRRQRRPAALWNIACDVVVNEIMTSQTALPPPRGSLIARDISPDLEAKCAEQVYEWLVKNQRSSRSLEDGLESSERSRAEAPRDSPDETDFAPAAVRANEARKRSLSAAFARVGGKPRGAETVARSTPRMPATKRAPLHDLQPAEPEEQESEDALRGHWETALAMAEQQLRSRPLDVGGGILREFHVARHPRIDWRTTLYQYVVRSMEDVSGFDRRFIHAGLYLDAFEQERIDVEVAIDTSGSISSTLLDVFMVELSAILGSYPHIGCNLYYCDAVVDGPHAITTAHVLPEPIGGGGTDFSAFFATLDRGERSRSHQLVVYFTDGEGRFPEQAPSCPVLWVVAPGGAEDHRFPFGRVARLND